jgi:hypothetical protein
MMSSVEEDDVNTDALQWSCDSCTFMNNKDCQPHKPDETQVCEMCNSERYSLYDECDMFDDDSPDTDEVAVMDASNIPFMYELVAVLRHIGTRPSAGHYTCDVKLQQGGATQKTWQHCDDSVLSPISQVSCLCQTLSYNSSNLVNYLTCFVFFFVYLSLYYLFQKSVLQEQQDPYMLFYQKC